MDSSQSKARGSPVPYVEPRSLSCGGTYNTSLLIHLGTTVGKEYPPYLSVEEL
jgi:hypothetical protein